MPGAFSSNVTQDNLPPKAKEAKKDTKNSEKIIEVKITFVHEDNIKLVVTV